MPPLRLTLLGSFTATSPDQDLVALQRQPALQSLLAFLALHPGTPLPRQQVAFTLWPDTSEKQARANLRQSLYALRSIMGPSLPLQIDQQTITLEHNGALWVDLWVFDACLDAPDSQDRLQSALDLYRGALLEGRYADWLAPFRERYERRYQEALERLAERCEARGELDRAITLTRRLLESDPFQERVARSLMRRLARAGDRAAALACFEQLRRLLEAELGAAPLDETTALAAQIARSETDGNAPPCELPCYTSPFLGREPELAELARLLADPACRLVVLLGMGGIGKTRLAIQAASDNRRHFADGVFFVSLVEVRNAAALTAAVFDALRLPRHPGIPLDQQLREYLRTRRLLLVLDNAESLRGNVAAIDELMRHVPGLTLLVTSRERLFLSGEWLLPVDGLPPPREPTAAALARSSAAQLFLQRARMVRPDFASSEADSPEVAAICRRLDGMPLGLELAASWARAASCAQIAAILARPLTSLAVPFRDIDPRHHSLRTVILHSWSALDAEEQRALLCLTACRGGCDGAAAVAISSAREQTLWALVDKSLLRYDNSGRYQLHELVRQFLDEQPADPADRATARQRHFEHFLALAEAVEQHMHGPDQAHWRAVLEADHENLRAAFAWALSSADATLALRLSGALWMFWYAAGYFGEGLSWCEAALAHADELGAAVDPNMRATALSQGGSFAHLQGDVERARALHQQSLSLRRTLGDRRAIAASLNNLGLLADHQGMFAEAISFYEEAITLWRGLDWPNYLATTLNNQGVAYFGRGDTAQAQRLLEESLNLWRRLGDRRNLGLVLYNLADVALAEQHYLLSHALFDEALGHLETTGERRFIGHVLIGRALVALAQGRLEQARTDLEQGLAILRAINDQVKLARCLEAFAALSAAQGQPEGAAQLLAAAEQLRITASAPATVPERRAAERTADVARAALGPAAWKAATTAGRLLPWEQSLQMVFGAELRARNA
ncbi:MAG: BTAD domain-containing putative transcriptional regulator [Roseiflexaceae bacterium]